jgi:hypothetical protein
MQLRNFKANELIVGDIVEIEGLYVDIVNINNTLEKEKTIIDYTYHVGGKIVKETRSFNINRPIKRFYPWEIN